MRAGGFPLTFSSSLRLAGDTSECLRISGLRGGANPLPSAPIWLPVGPSRASLCRLWSASRIGTSSSESVDSCVTIGWSLEAIFRRQTLHRQEDWNGERGEKKNGSSRAHRRTYYKCVHVMYTRSSRETTAISIGWHSGAHWRLSRNYLDANAPNTSIRLRARYERLDPRNAHQCAYILLNNTNNLQPDATLSLF